MYNLTCIHWGIMLTFSQKSIDMAMGARLALLAHLRLFALSLPLYLRLCMYQKLLLKSCSRQLATVMIISKLCTIIPCSQVEDLRSKVQQPANAHLVINLVLPFGHAN